MAAAAVMAAPVRVALDHVFVDIAHLSPDPGHDVQPHEQQQQGSVQGPWGAVGAASPHGPWSAVGAALGEEGDVEDGRRAPLSAPTLTLKLHHLHFGSERAPDSARREWAGQGDGGSGLGAGVGIGGALEDTTPVGRSEFEALGEDLAADCVRIVDALTQLQPSAHSQAWARASRGHTLQPWAVDGALGDAPPLEQGPMVRALMEGCVLAPVRMRQANARRAAERAAVHSHQPLPVGAADQGSDALGELLATAARPSISHLRAHAYFAPPAAAEARRAAFDWLQLGMPPGAQL
jgi:hypothetical protein